MQRLLPPGLTAETFGGTAWIGLIPFLMEGIRPPVLPAMPWLSRFGEINVRTYVHDDQGRSGIWFFSLDAARLPAVAAARAGYWLPYFWSDISDWTGLESASPAPISAICPSATRTSTGSPSP